MKRKYIFKKNSYRKGAQKVPSKCTRGKTMSERSPVKKDPS